MGRIVLPNNWQPRPYQLPAWTYLENGGRHAELVWHRRSGKDEIALHRAACAAFERVAGYWHMLPEYSQARKAIWDAVNPHTGKKRIDEAFPHELRAATRNQEMLIQFKNGSTWQVVGSDSYNSLVGSTPAGIVYSEWALANPAARAYLRPILAENKGWQVFITTSRGRNHAHTTLKAAQKTPGAFAQVLDAYQTGVFAPEQLEIEKAAYIAEFGEEYGLAKFEQEYLCSFDAANLGAILARSIGLAEKAGRIGDHIDYDPLGADLVVSMDIGRRDTTTVWVWQPTLGGYHIIDYARGWGLDAEEWAVKVRDLLAKYRRADGKPALGKIWMPHDARAKTFAAKHSALECFIKVFGAGLLDIVPDSSISDRVNAARVMIDRCAFNETKVSDGLDGLRAWSYKFNEESKIFSQQPEHDWASHDGDGFSYGCQVMRLAKPPEPKKPVLLMPTFNDLMAEARRKRLSEE